ncbi:MAG: proton-conducting transporter membrane subunit [Microthrixaceae bacterium]
MTAFLLALAYRSWQLTGDDLVEDDVEDRRIAGHGRRCRSRRRGGRRLMRVLLPLPVIACLLGAGASMAFGRNRIAQRIIGSAALLTALGVAIGILRHVDADGPAAAFMGGWKAPVGIALVADRFTAIMLLVSAVVLLGVLMFAIGQPGTEQEQPSFHPVYLVLAAGVFLSFLTGDLFNLFVAFEMMLTASYILITLGGRLDQVQTGMTYVVINLVASTFFVVLLGLLYAALGTVNMADLAERMHTLPERCPGRVRAPACSWCSASRPRCSPCSSGCRTATRRRRPR